MCLMDERCGLIIREKFSSDNFCDKSSFRKIILKNFSHLLAFSNIHPKEVRAVGIGLPGPIDATRGVVLSLTNIPGWDNFPLVSFLKKDFNVPLSVENDANCMALAEVRLGAALGASYALCITLGTGVGGGLILDGKIYRSPYFLGGEIGHIPIDANGPECDCGGKGCLERYVGNRALLRKARTVFKRDMALEEVSILAASGNKKAREFWEDVGCDIGLALSSVVNIFNPSVIVVGGGVADAGDFLLKAIQHTVRIHAMKQLKNKIKVVKASLGGDAGVLGAALLAKERIKAGF